MGFTVDIYAIITSFAVVLTTIVVCNFLHKRNLASSSTLRKTVHIMAGVLWSALWLAFSSREAAIFVCLVVTMAAALVAATQKMSGTCGKIVKAFTYGDESFVGLVLYAISLTLVTFFFFYQKHIGTAAFLALALGDGTASTVGEKLGKHTYAFPHSRVKSIEGSLACFLFSCLGTLLSLTFLVGGQASSKILSTSVAGATAMVVEATTPKHTDNLTVPMATAVVLTLVL
jgi:dolichol kinase